MNDKTAGSTVCICLICSGTRILKSARCVSQVILCGSSVKLVIWYPIALVVDRTARRCNEIAIAVFELG